MNKILLIAGVLFGSIATTAIPANAGVFNSSYSSTTTTVINTTTNNTVINNGYGRGNYYRNKNRFGYHRPVYHPPSNSVQFRIPVRLNIFGSDINLNIDSQGYKNYNRH
jgi:hypothetical protein